MSAQKYIAKMTGYKATHADMSCGTKGGKYFHQFELGVWQEIDGDIELCKHGFHFCVYPSGPSSFYTESTARFFKIEAEQVLEVETQAGADFKLVAKRIRLVEEITPLGYSNTGDRNTGYSNTGDGNTGDGNTGDGNTGDRNTGHSNTGYGNTTNNSAGFFCDEEPKVISFDHQTKLTRDQFRKKYPEYYRLSELLLNPTAIEFEPFKRIPGITPTKLKALHKKHIQGRKLVTK